MSELHRAVAKKDKDETRRLLEAGADANELDEKGEPPLWYALDFHVGFCFSDHERIIMQLLMSHGADPKVAAVGQRMKDLAWKATCSALEAGYARELEHILGLR